jgi:hypothetical protein
MNIIIAGSREGFSRDDVYIAMRDAMAKFRILPIDVTVISGTARGVDQLGELWAKQQAEEKYHDKFGL